VGGRFDATAVFLAAKSINIDVNVVSRQPHQRLTDVDPLW
jgi:hypothetical protein